MRNTSLVRTAIGLCLTASSLLLAGCGGGGSNGPGVGGVGTSTVFGPAKAVNGGTARSYVTLTNNVVTAVGIEMSESTLTGVPALPDGVPQIVSGLTLPAQAASTPFKEVGVEFFSSHNPAGVGTKPHYHPLFLLNALQTPDPPAFAKENVAVAAGEVPMDHVKLTEVAPGIGVEYQDPAQPEAQPGWDSFGQHYFFYNGHLNAIALSATNAYLQRLQANTDIARGDIIKQPAVYPVRSLYPQRYTIHHDPTRRSFIFELSDFQLKG